MVCLRRVRAALVLVVGLLAVGAPTAHAAGERITKTVPAEIVIEHGSRPGKPGHCSAVSFAQWKKVPGTKSASVSYVYAERDYSKSGSAPFDNTFEWVRKYTAPGGTDRIQLGKRWINGSKPNDCSEDAADYNEHYVKGALVVLTIECSAKRTTQSRAGSQAVLDAACPAPDCTTATAEMNAMLTSLRDIASSVRQPPAARANAKSAVDNLRANLVRQKTSKRYSMCRDPFEKTAECDAAMKEQAEAFEAVNHMASGLRELAFKSSTTAESVVRESSRLVDMVDRHQTLTTRAASLCK